MIKAKKQLVCVLIEATYGVDPIPTGANAFVVQNLKVSPMELNAQERNVVRGFFGAAGKVISGEHVKFSGEIELFASGVAGTAPPYNAMLKACALSETTVVGTSVTYAPVESGEQSVTIYFNMDGKLRKILGLRSDLKLKMSAKGTPAWTFDGIGLYTTPTDTAMLTPTLTAWKTPLAVQAGVTTASLHGYAGAISQFDFNLGNQIAYSNLINGESVRFSGRKCTGSITIEEPTVATKDFDSIISAQTLGALTLTHGTVAGNRFQFTANNTQIVSMSPAEVDGHAFLNLGLEFVATAAGNDFSLVFN